MSRLDNKKRTALLKDLALGEKTNAELAHKFDVSESYCQELRETVEACLETSNLTHESLTSESFRKALAPLEAQAREFLIAGMSIKQVHEVTRLSTSLLKHYKEIYRDEIGNHSAVSIYRQSIEGQLMCTAFAINYAPFAQKKKRVEITDVLIALRLAHRQTHNIFPDAKEDLRLREAYEIAVVLNSEKESNEEWRKFILDVCPKCSMPFLQYEAPYRPKQRCPFCELKKQITSKEQVPEGGSSTIESTESVLLNLAKKADATKPTTEEGK